jgi:hypothetical protein
LDWKVNAFAAEVSRVYGRGDRRQTTPAGDLAAKRVEFHGINGMLNGDNHSAKFITWIFSYESVLWISKDYINIG